jgi:hypothetical protein
MDMLYYHFSSIMNISSNIVKRVVKLVLYPFFDMSRSKKPIVIHPYLFVIFPIIFLYSHNIHEVEFYEILVPSAIALIFTSLLVISLLIIFRDTQKVGIIVVLFLIS